MAKAKRISDLLPKVLQENNFEGRSRMSELVSLWDELFDGHFGRLVERNGDVLIVQVQGAPMKSELESFKKYEILEVLHLHQEFSAIRDLKFRE